jgi:hypothetical protein
MIRLVLAGFLLCACGCSRAFHPHIQSVDQIAPDRERLASGIGDNSFEDDFISAKWSLAPYTLDIELSNRTDRPLKVMWDEVAYVDHAGLSHRVATGGLRAVGAEAAPSVSVIPQGGRLKESIAPADNRIQKCPPSNFYRCHWTLLGLFEGAGYAEKDIKVQLPIYIGDQRREYLFSLRVDTKQ